MIRAVTFIFEIFSFPDFGRPVWRTIRRKVSLASYRPLSELISLITEPLLLLLALSLGLGHWLKEIDGQSYPQYVLPAVAVACSVFVPYWEVAFGVFSRIRQSHPYWVALQGPITASDLANGELLWGSLKGMLAATIILFVGALLGWAPSSMIWLTPLVLLPGSLLFAAFGLWSAVTFKSPLKLIMIQGLILGPLCLWSDTLFPFSQTGQLAAWSVFLSPAGQMVNSLRALTSAEVSANFFLNLALLWSTSCVATNFAVLRFCRRLIPR